MPILHLDAVELHYEITGRGPPLLLIAGTACDGRFWAPHQVPDFQRDFTVITFDQRGTGKTVTRGNDFSTRALAADAAALIAHVGLGPAVVMGHSMGGRVAQWVALDNAALTRKLILASTGSVFKNKGGIAPKMCLAIVEKGYKRYIREHSVEIGFSHNYILKHPAEVEACVDLIVDMLPPLDVYFAHVMSRQDHDTTVVLKDISVPTLVMVGGDETHGNSDTTHVQSSEILAKNIPGARFVRMDGHGHFYHFSDPEGANWLVRDFVGIA